MSIRLLVADDEPGILRLYNRILSTETSERRENKDLLWLEEKLFGNNSGQEPAITFELTACRQSEEAVLAVQQALETSRPFAVAFLDIRMPPGPDGVWAAEQIRKLDPHIEIVMVTGFSDVSPEEINRRVPPAHKLLYIQKPFHTQEITQFSFSLGNKWLAEKKLLQLQEQLEATVAHRTRELARTNVLLEDDIARRKEIQVQLQESEVRYRHLFENAHDMIQSVDPNGRFLFVNRSWKDTMGYSDKEICDFSLFDIIHPDSFTHCQKEFKKLMQGETLKNIEVTFKNKNGKAIILEGSVVPREINGKISATHGFFRDITERKAAQDQIRRNLEIQSVINKLLSLSLENLEFDDILSQSLNLVISLPRFVFEERGCIFLMQEHTGSLVLSAQKRLSSQDVNPCLTVPMGKCLCGRAALTQEILFADSDNDRHDIRWEGMPLHGHCCVPIVSSGKTLGVLNLFLKPGHISEQWEEDFLWSVSNTLAGIIVRKNAEREKEKIEMQLYQAQKMDALGTLASGIAHDFNNILAAIIGNAELALFAQECPDPVKERLDGILDAGRRAKDLVKQILAFSRKNDEGKKPLRVSDMVLEVVRLLKPSLPRTIDFVQSIEAKDTMVRSNPTHIHQILMNLCTNAFHAMGEAGGTLKVSQTLAVVGPPSEEIPANLIPGVYVKLSVSDTGHGIEAETIERIFDPYFTTKKQGEGTGLGLSVVHGIVEQLNGGIKVISKAGTGTTFHVYLPALDMVSAEPE